MSINYSTCRDCGGLLHVTDRDTVHPLCTPRPTSIETMAQQYREAVEAGDEFLIDGLEDDIERLDARPPDMLAAALSYTSWGWPVFPLKPNTKVPATRNGFKDATTDSDRIRTWWTATPEANIGLPTGHVFDVIDIDPPIGSMTYHQLLVEGAIPDSHAMVATSRGGMHLYIPATGDGNGAGIYPGIDYRGVGGYVVAPPSTLGVVGRAWSWINQPSPVLTHAVAQESVA